MDFQHILYETPDDAIVRIILNRPKTLNAQNTRMLYEMNDALDMAAQDDSVKVIIVAANGKHFSSGHDLREEDPVGVQKEFKQVTTWGGFERDGAEGQFAREQEVYLGFCERWRNSRLTLCQSRTAKRIRRWRERVACRRSERRWLQRN